MRERALHSIIAATLLIAAAAGAADLSCAPGTTLIPDGAGSITRSIEVAPTGLPLAITAVRVQVALSHPWVGDLRLVLRHPSGVEVVLLDRPGVDSGGGAGIGFPGPWGCGGDDLAVLFDDAAILPAESACETAGTAIVGSKQPLQPLALLNGLAPTGSWTLIASDLVAQDAGSLGTVCIEIETAPVSLCPADLDASGTVDAADLAILLGGWGPGCTGCASDLNADATVDAADLAILLGAWGRCPG